MVCVLRLPRICVGGGAGPRGPCGTSAQLSGEPRRGDARHKEWRPARAVYPERGTSYGRSGTDGQGQTESQGSGQGKTPRRRPTQGRRARIKACRVARRAAPLTGLTLASNVWSGCAVCYLYGVSASGNTRSAWVAIAAHRHRTSAKTPLARRRRVAADRHRSPSQASCGTPDLRKHRNPAPATLRRQPLQPVDLPATPAPARSMQRGPRFEPGHRRGIAPSVHPAPGSPAEAESAGATIYRFRWAASPIACPRPTASGRPQGGASPRPRALGASLTTLRASIGCRRAL